MSFVAGQPLGYYGSWALFSLSPHIVVWLAAELSSYPGKFNDYTVLGYGVVIADTEVAKTYEELLRKLGVFVS